MLNNNKLQFKLLWALPLIYLVVSSCATSGKFRQPTLAEGHVGQTLVASSETATKHSLIDTALSQLRQLESLNRALRLEAAKQNALTTRQLFIEMAGLIDSPAALKEKHRNSLSFLIERTLHHLDLAARAPDATPAIQSLGQVVAEEGIELQLKLDRLANLVAEGLNSDTNAEAFNVLRNITDKIESAAANIRGDEEGTQGLALLRLKHLVNNSTGDAGKKLAAADPWYFQNFVNDSGAVWAYRAKPKHNSNSQNEFGGGSDSPGSTPSTEGDDDDDD